MANTIADRLAAQGRQPHIQKRTKKVTDAVGLGGLVVAATLMTFLAVAFTAIRLSIPGFLFLIAGLLTNIGFLTVTGIILLAGALLLSILATAVRLLTYK